MIKTYPCSRCSGNGTISAYANVLGGVCFKCGGKGTQAARPVPPSINWVVLGTDRNSGERVHAYNVRAQTAAKAIGKALRTYENASAAWRDSISLSDPIALPFAQWWTDERIDATAGS